MPLLPELRYSSSLSSLLMSICRKSCLDSTLSISYSFNIFSEMTLIQNWITAFQINGSLSKKLKKISETECYILLCEASHNRYKCCPVNWTTLVSIGRAFIIHHAHQEISNDSPSQANHQKPLKTHFLYKYS